MGVWIETGMSLEKYQYIQSLLMWECGLKQLVDLPSTLVSLVTPYVGVWIETVHVCQDER